MGSVLAKVSHAVLLGWPAEDQPAVGTEPGQRLQPQSVPNLCVRAPGSSVGGGDVCLAMALGQKLLSERPACLSLTRKSP